jgi:hypothetical protein
MSGTTARSRIRLAKAAQNLPEPQTVNVNDVFQNSSVEVRVNPLADLIDDPTYSMLEQHKLIDQKSLRDYLIRKSFREMREKMSAGDAIDKLQQMHPYLQFDTIRKIVYQMSKSS